MPDLIGMYLDYARLEGLAPKTTVYRRGNALRRLERTLQIELIEAGALVLAEWRAGLTLGDQTVLNYVTDLRRFYAWAVEQGFRADNPAAGLPVPRPGRRLPRPISSDDLFHALQVAPDRVRPWLILAAWCGLRAQEIARLRRECVLDTMRPPSLLVTQDAAKGRKERLVPVAPWALAELRACGMPASGWMYTRADGVPGPNTPGQVSRVANKFLHAAGIDATLHQLRHWFGTESYRAKRDLRAVQEMMGHEDPAYTAGYAAYCQQEAAEIVAALPVPGLRAAA